MRRGSFLIPVFVISSSLAFSQGALTTKEAIDLSVQNKALTLKEALDLAVQNSKELKVSKTNLEIAQAKLAQAKDQALPELKASGMYLFLNTPTVSMASGESSGTSGGSGSGSGSNPLAIFSKMHSVGLAQLSLTQPIFGGFKVRNNRIMQGYLAEAAKYDETTTRSKVIANTAKALYQYYEMLETKKLIEQNAEQAKQRVTEFTNQEKQGVLAKNDLLKAELQLNNILLTLTEVNNNIQVAEYNIQILLGVKTFALDTTGMFQKPTFETAENLETTALDKRTEAKSAFMQMKASEAASKITKSAYYPSLALTGGYVNVFIPNVANITNVLNGGLSLSYNLTGLINTKHRMQEATAHQRQVEVSTEIVNDQIKLEVRRKVLEYQKSLEKIELNKKSIEQAQENYNISKNKFGAGLMITSDYLEADVTLLQTQINYATAKAESMIAWYELQQATGNIE